MSRRGRRRFGMALVALGEESECVNLFDEIGHTGPPAEPESDDQNPRDYARVHHKHRRPAPPQHRRRFLRCILQQEKETHLTNLD